MNKIKKNKNLKSIIIMVVCLIVVALCIVYIAGYYIKKSNNEKIYESLQQTTVEDVEIPIDFVSLQTTINPDIYAWIKIPDTTIDYPVVQHATDNTYYLDNTIEHQSGYPGSIYTENFNSKDFSDFNTVIYGHNMNNGSMFGNLKEFRDSAYLEQHPQITVYTEDTILTYEIFAVVTFSDKHLLNTYDYSTEEGRTDFLTDLKDVRDFDSQILTDVPVNEDSKILTLSTCIKNQSSNRLAIGAVLIDEQE